MDEATGGVYLVAWLEPSQTGHQRYEFIDLAVSNGGAPKVFIRNRILIRNANTQAPDFIECPTFLEIVEVRCSKKINSIHSISYTLKDSDSLPVELGFRNPYPVEAAIQVVCENMPEYPEACSLFALYKNETKSNTNEWFGHLRVSGPLNFLDHPLVQFFIVAMVHYLVKFLFFFKNTVKQTKTDFFTQKKDQKSNLNKNFLKTLFLLSQKKISANIANIRFNGTCPIQDQ